MSHAGRAALAVALLVVGVAVGLAAVAVHAWWWGLLLAAVTSVSSVFALPPRWFLLLPFALGWWAPVLVAMAGRREGDYAVEGAAAGYLLLALGAVVLVSAAFLVTLHWPARTRPEAVPGSGSAPRGAR